jgi:hypothetical protein
MNPLVQQLALCAKSAQCFVYVCRDPSVCCVVWVGVAQCGQLQYFPLGECDYRVKVVCMPMLLDKQCSVVQIFRLCRVNTFRIIG